MCVVVTRRSVPDKKKLFSFNEFYLVPACICLTNDVTYADTIRVEIQFVGCFVRVEISLCLVFCRAV